MGCDNDEPLIAERHTRLLLGLCQSTCASELQVGGTRPHLCPKRGGIRSAGEGGSKGSSGISDDVLQRLRLAEEEAVKLREELAKAKAEALERVRSKKYAVRVI